MRNWLTYCLLCIGATICYSTPPEWKVTRTPEFATFIFRKDFLSINGNPTTFETGDAIAVFSLDGNKYVCVGFDTITNFTDSLIVRAYKKDTSQYGFLEGSNYKLLYWHKALNCQFEIAKQNIPDSLFSKSNTRVNSSNTSISTIKYSQSAYYQSDTIGYATPLITLKPSGIPMTYNFYSKVAGLDIVEYSGRITLKTSVAPRTYTIHFKSSYCMSTNDFTLMTDTINVTILQDTLPKSEDSLNIDSLTYKSSLPTCTRAGTLLISQKNIKGTSPFFFQLQHQFSQKIYTSNTGNFDELPSGIYKLQVTDSVGATVTYHSPVTLLILEDCTTNPVLTPDNRNGLQTLYISDAGLVKIVDREGKTIRELTVPGEWDGTDGKGSPAQMGDYYLFLNGQQYKIVTIIR